ncbi:MAG: hypothetical protein JXR87_10910 [Candidatus Marinimicrobia bacterium]|nr:hypothetical protein [Candidatus Neomarinimicrobiota bacterium]
MVYSSLSLTHKSSHSRPGSYFATLCTRGHECLFGDITDGEMVLNDVGEMVEQCLLAIPGHYKNVELDKWAIMPNHVHMIMVINPNQNTVGTQNFVPLQHKFQHVIPKSIGSIIRGFKTGVTKWCRKHTDIHIVWQRNYYKHIIRDEHELNKIRRYIINNPPQWEYDRENQNSLPTDEKQKFWSKFLNEFD